MNILLIEDETNKANQILQYLSHHDINPEVVHRRSYQSGLSEIYDRDFDLIVMDMSLPTFDIEPGEDAYKFRHIGGHDILAELKRKRRKARVVVLTQFERFGEGNQFIALKDLKRVMRRDFSDNYLETISYHPNKTAWQTELNELIKRKST